MRVPEEAGSGIAKITLSYPAWKEGKVAPATFAIPVEESKPKPPGNGSKAPTKGGE